MAGSRRICRRGAEEEFSTEAQTLSLTVIAAKISESALRSGYNRGIILP